MKNWHVTYEIITPESAEHGEAAEGGYYVYGGWHHQIEHIMALPDDQRDQEIAAMAMDLRSALRCVGSLEDSGRWFSGVDPDRSMFDGSEEYRSLHPPERITPSSYQRVKRLLRSMRML